MHEEEHTTGQHKSVIADVTHVYRNIRLPGASAPSVGDAGVTQTVVTRRREGCCLWRGWAGTCVPRLTGFKAGT